MWLFIFFLGGFAAEVVLSAACQLNQTHLKVIQ
jgi:hypothetical protein